MDKEKLTRHLIHAQDKLLVLRLLDKAERAERQYVLHYTDFLDPYQLSLCKGVLANIPEIAYCTFGGIKNAERNVLAIYPESMTGYALENPLEALRMTGNFSQTEITHRDVLGAVLGLGIKREKIGDILVGEGKIDFIAFKDICSFLCVGLEKISKYKVSVESITFDKLKKPYEQSKTISGTVSSLRLDSILALGFGESRSSISKGIHHDNVKVNWRAVNQLSYVVKEGDVISLKGKGRIILEEIGNKTKKDRIKIVVKRLI